MRVTPAIAAFLHTIELSLSFVTSFFQFGITLNLLAFLFYTVLHLVDTSYQQIRQQRGTRKGFFQDILALTKYLLFHSWEHLIDFMLSDAKPTPAADSS